MIRRRRPAYINLVERVARAISREEIWSEENLQRYGDLWIISAREEAMRQARAAIEAMRKPTVDMVWAGWDQLDMEPSPHAAAACWDAMVEEALR